MSTVRVLVLTGFGLNCDMETAHAFELAGARPERVHINSLIDGSARLEDYRILAFGGGFSWGDDHGAGVIQAVRMGTRLRDQIRDFISGRGLVIGICNGFQTLVNLGLLPGLDGNYSERSVALTHNDCGNFRDEWVHLRINPDSPCVFTRGLPPMELPVRHGEGKLVADPKVLDRLTAANQVVLQYARPDGEPAGGVFPHNPNGSLMDIAAICDPTGRIFGLMPHPEAFNDWTNHPQWTFEAEKRRRRGEPMFPDEPTPGIRMFRNAVEYVADGA
ncbi:MAG: phosphoribosylformylglycinamidine synthase subunit PurQ [Desulfobacterales bacterium]